MHASAHASSVVMPSTSSNVLTPLLRLFSKGPLYKNCTHSNAVVVVVAELVVAVAVVVVVAVAEVVVEVVIVGD